MLVEISFLFMAIGCRGSKHVRITLRPAEQTIRLCVSDHLLFVSVPNQLTPEQVSEVAQVTEGRGAMTYFNIHRRAQVTFADRFKPIGLVVHVEILVLVGPIYLLAARWQFEIDGIWIGGFVAAFPFEHVFSV